MGVRSARWEPNMQRVRCRRIMSKDVVRPTPPECLAEYKEYFDTPFALYLGQVKLTAVNDLMKTPPRPNNATTAVNDDAACALKAHKTGGTQGTAAVKAARQELYEKDQQAGAKLKEIAKQFSQTFHFHFHFHFHF